MLDRIQQPRTWLILGLLIILSVVVYIAATADRNETTLAASVEADESIAEHEVSSTDVEAVKPAAEAKGEVTILTEDDRPGQLRAATNSWNTNWNRRTIEYNELLSGGPPRDGIPSIDAPQFISPDAAQEWLADNEPVIALEIDGAARAYPLQILTWHEIVNDVVTFGASLKKS